MDRGSTHAPSTFQKNSDRYPILYVNLYPRLQIACLSDKTNQISMNQIFRSRIPESYNEFTLEMRRLSSHRQYTAGIVFSRARKLFFGIFTQLIL